MKKYAPLKRALDMAFSAIGLVVTAPILAACVIAVRAETPGPAVFKQTRLGQKGAPFTMYKFRSMTLGAEAGGVYEADRDTRVTKVGRALRRSSLDELPQLVNILSGKMSFVGPRPTLTYHPWPFEDYTDEQKRRFDVRPGVTGLAQISGRKQVPWTERLKLDVEYTDTMSFSRDASILLGTLHQVVTAAGNINVGATAPGSAPDGPNNADL